MKKPSSSCPRSSFIPAGRSAQRKLLALGASLMTLGFGVGPALAAGYTVHPLVTDDQSVLATLPYGPAPTVDPALINPWDATNTPSGKWVIANTGGAGAGVPGTITIYSSKGKIEHSPIAVPEGNSPPYGPTGITTVVGAGFKLPNGKAADYLTDNLDGSISGWSGGDTATTVVPGRGGGNVAAYTALELGTSGGATYLYAANNITGIIDVYDTSFSKVALTGAFVDPGPNPDGLFPYNIENIGTQLWVTYAVPGPSASAAPLGSGFVSVFNMDGTFVRRFATGGMLSSPWGITIAPANFGKYSNDVLIGNFNDGPTEGFINAFDPTTGKRVGTLKQSGAAIVLPGLWAMQFGSGKDAGKLFFAAGIGQENHGLFGEISAGGSK
jgi:uncharacterized protein (TIGR03118 family)